MEISQQKSLVSLAVEASLLAGKEILKVYEQDFEVYTKSDQSPLTMADQKAHEVIQAMLEKTRFPILSEEGKEIPYEVRKSWDHYWIVDPLDGTKEFVKRNGDFTVNIAFMHINKPIFGIIYIPVTDELYFGGSDLSSYKHSNFSKKMDFSASLLFDHNFKLPCQDLPEKYTIVASSSHLSLETENYMKKLEETKGKVNIISRGSSLKICMVAEGSAHEYPRFAPTMEWDIAAGHGIILGVNKEIIDHHT